MKVPKYIKYAIERYCDLNSKAQKYENQIRDWLEKNNLTEETMIDVNANVESLFVDCCTMTNNPNDFIEVLEDIKVNPKFNIGDRVFISGYASDGMIVTEPKNSLGNIVYGVKFDDETIGNQLPYPFYINKINLYKI